MVEHCGTLRQSVKFEKNLWDYWVQPLSDQPCWPDHVQPFLKRLPPIPTLSSHFSEAIPPNIQFKQPPAQSEIMPSCPVTVCQGELSLPHLATPSFSGGCEVSVAGSAVFSPFLCFVCVTLRPQSAKEGWQNYSKSVLRRLGIAISRQSVSQSNLSFKVYKRKSVTTAAIFVS